MMWTESVARRLSRPALWLSVVAGSAALITGCNDKGIKGATTPDAFWNPQQFRFPKLPAGQHNEQTVKVENRGSRDLTVAHVEANFGDQFHLYWFPNSDSTHQRVIVDQTGHNVFNTVHVAPGESMTLVLEYDATMDEPSADSVVLDTDNPDDDGKIEIPIRVDNGGPEIFVNPSTLDFGRVAAHAHKDLATTVTNTGQAPLVFSDMQVNGDQHFHAKIGDKDVVATPAVLDDPDKDGTPGLAPGAHFDLTVTFSPENDGPATGELAIVTNDPEKGTYTVNLRANGASPCIKVTPPSREFPPTVVGHTDTRPITIESCGGEALQIKAIHMKDGSDPSFALGELPMLPAALPAAEQGQPNPSRNIDIQFTPPDQQAYGGTVVIEENDPATCEDPEDPSTCKVEVPLVGRGILNACPVPAVAQDMFDVLPLDVVDLDGSRSSDPDGMIGQYTWVVTDRPDGSTAEPAESYVNPRRPNDGSRPDDPATPHALFFVDLAGDYTIELHVTDNLGTEAPSETCPDPVATVHIHSQPHDDIHIQLVWDTPGDRNQTDNDGSDVDLHFMHPLSPGWMAAPLDCYYANPTPDWGQLGNQGDNPSLDIDDTNGAGPENVNMDSPEDTSQYRSGYRVGVHYYRSDDLLGGSDYGPSDVTTRIYLGGQLAYEKTVNLRRTDYFWDVAQIVWTPQRHEVVEVNRVTAHVPN